MTINFIKKNINIFIQIIQEFASEAEFLVKKLVMVHNLNLEGKIPINVFSKLKYEAQFGYLDDEWKYFFHGFECRFTHKDGKIVDVVLKYKDEYSHIMFIGKYIETNTKYSNISKKIKDTFQDECKIIKVLKEYNLISEFENEVDIILEFGDDEKEIFRHLSKGIKLNQNNVELFLNSNLSIL